MSTTPIIDQIRQLLAQAESTNHKAEAETCRKRAAKLMLRHGIDEAALQPSEQKPEVDCLIVPVSGTYARADVDIYNGVASGTGLGVALFRMESYSRGVVYLNAHKSDLPMLGEMCESFVNQAHTAMKAWWKEQRPLYRELGASETDCWNARRSFISSFGKGVYREMTSARTEFIEENPDAGTEMVLLDRSLEVHDWVESNYKTKTGSDIKHDRWAASAGMAAGRQAAASRG